MYELRDERGRTFYVGKGSMRRVRFHEAKARAGHMSHTASHIRSIWARGGDVLRVIVFRSFDERECLAEEKRRIALHGRDVLTNKTDGGDGISNPSMEVREKIAAARRGRKASEETRAKQREAKLGKSRSQSTRQKIGNYQRGSSHPWASATALANLQRINAVSRAGIPLSEDHKQAIAEAKRGHAVSAETRAKISASKRGSVPWNKGKRTGGTKPQK